VGRRLLFVLAAAAALLIPAQARAGIPLTACGSTGVQCGTVVVPLDRTGKTTGTIPLYVEYLPAPSRVVRGTLFFIAGGPGQGSASSFDFSSAAAVSFYQAVFPGYAFVAFDNRGTGKSGLLDCPGLQRAVGVTLEQEQALTRECADQIGPTRQFYATRDHAEDIEAVRQALDLGKIGLYGVSYGTKLALAYALAHPGSVDRLLLDSVVPPDYPDPFDRVVASQMPATLNAFCAGGRCRGATSSYAADVAAVANRFEAKPAVGTVIAPGGRKVSVRLNGEDFVGMMIDSDLSPGLAAELPAAVHAARGGYTKPLLRLFNIDQRTSVLTSESLSFGLNAATNCADGHFPWSPDTPIESRQGIWNAAVAAEPASSFGLFGKWAARLGTASFCLQWPSPAGNTPLGAGPLPNVPVLALSGGYDMRTPTANAVSIISKFPQGHLVVVPGVGHDALDSDFSACSARDVRQWMLGATLPAVHTCPRAAPFVKVLTAFPRSGPAHTAAATVAAAAKTVRESEAAWLQAIFSPVDLAPAGLYGGKVTPNPSGLGFTLTSYSVAPGIALSGKVTAKLSDTHFVFSGTLRVSGPRAVGGTLKLTAKGVAGSLGGRRVSAGV